VEVFRGFLPGSPECLQVIADLDFTVQRDCGCCGEFDVSKCAARVLPDSSTDSTHVALQILSQSLEKM
jgi:hypothetical protein